VIRDWAEGAANLISTLRCVLFHRDHHKHYRRLAPGSRVTDNTLCTKCGAFRRRK
jgi:hypothetical protein